MMLSKKHIYILVVIGYIMLCPVLLLGTNNTSIIEGIILDSESGEPLPGTNVYIVGTNIGTATDLNGKYAIMSLPPGEYTFRATYIGYASQEKTVLVRLNEKVKVNFEMKHATVRGKTVVVTAQAEGQLAAINQQIASNSIKNIVAADKIQELPEANAAEAVGRLPGVSLQRQGGEGNKIVIRGLAPKYNKVQIEGVDMASTNNWDRSTDLSMISSYMLEGIELTKSAMADQEANQLGGTVNFSLRGAPYKPTLNAIVQGGYNGLRQNASDYKFVGQASQRFFSDLIGISANIDVERRNRSSNNVSANYHFLQQDYLAVVDGLSISDVSRELDRYSGTFVMDYKTVSTDVKWSNMISKIDRSTVSRSENMYSLHSGSAGRNQSLNYAESSTMIMVNTLRAKQYLGNFKLDAGLGYSYSKNEVPERLSYGGSEATALARPVDKYAEPVDIPSYMLNDTSAIILSQLNDSDSFTKETEFSADFNLEWEYRISDFINLKLKTGAKYKQKNREYDYNTLFFPIQYTKAKANNAIIEHWPWMSEYYQTGKFPYLPFIDRDYDPGDFMAGRYSIERVPDLDMGIELIHYLQDYLGINWEGASEPLEFVPDFHTSKMNDYTGKEDYWGVYFMPTLALGKRFIFIPGVRYEKNKTDYTGVRGNANLMRESSQGYVYHDTTVTRQNEYFLPMIHAKYKPTDWFDVRFSYTETITRPSYMEFIPSWHIDMLSITYKNPSLKPSTSENIDLYFSFYGDKIGLFTVGGFKKKIDDLIFWQNKVILSDSMAVSDYGLLEEHTGQDPSRFAAKSISSFVNNPNPVDVWGIELEWQSNFWFLPGFLKNIVLNVNYTHTFSEAHYPRTVPEKEYVTSPFGGKMEVIVGNIDSAYTAPLLFQPDDIVNLTLGYDYKGFSIRASLQYKSEIFSSNNWRPELRGYTDGFFLYDLAVTQKLPIDGLVLFSNVKNLTRTIETDINRGTGYISNEQYYGVSADIGLKYIFQ